MEIKEPKFKPNQKISFNLKGKITSSKVVYCSYVLPMNEWQYVTEFDELFFIPEHCAVETPNHD